MRDDFGVFFGDEFGDIGGWRGVGGNRTGQDNVQWPHST